MARGGRGLLAARLGVVDRVWGEAAPERIGVVGAMVGVIAATLGTGLLRLGTGLAPRADTIDGEELCIMVLPCFICARAATIDASARGEPWALSGVSIDGFGVEEAIAAVATGVRTCIGV